MITHDLPNSTHGHRRARALAQAHADKVGHKVYLQTGPAWRRPDRLDVVIADDGRGPFWLGAPWREFWPE